MVGPTFAQAAVNHGPITSPALLNMTSLAASAVNVTSAFALPSKDQLLRLPLRLSSYIDRGLLYFWNHAILEGLGITTLAGAAVPAVAEGGMAQPAAQPGVPDLNGGEIGPEGWAAFFAEAFQASTFKSYWGMLHYLTSRWAFTCFAMALILNRIGVYAASRQRIQLTWLWRLALRLGIILLFVSQIRQLLQAIHCQTSPDFSLYRHGDNDKYSLLDWSTGRSGVLSDSDKY
jgi:hypothetical protein